MKSESCFYRYIIVWLLVLTGICSARTQEIFLQANKKYKEKEYNQALDMYRSIEHKGQAIWYKMGKCAYKLTDYVN